MELAFDRVTCRVKARTWPLGTARSRLFLVLRHLSLRREEIEARLRSERDQARALEIERLFQLQAEAEAARLVEDARAARFLQEREFLEAIEARRLAESQAFERMSEEQRAAWRMEEEIVEWIRG
jgi:hypothetical protein